MSSREVLFKRAVCDEAQRLGIQLDADAVQPCFAITNHARGTAVRCYRVEVSDPAELPKLAGLGVFKRVFAGVPYHELGMKLDVDYVLSGPTMNGKPVDWFGAPTLALA
ncbi:MAG: hypothetical protein Q7T63_08560 [Burkholderiaceae bacterium]|nr:hypothetical protein [Burkholderiaceae bacterium]MDP3136741.1 hypothetical protein [Burkholderiaceae bacterium]